MQTVEMRCLVVVCKVLCIEGDRRGCRSICSQGTTVADSAVFIALVTG